MNTESSADTNNPLLQKTLTFLSIPWCCVVSLVLTGIATSGSIVGVVFDEAFHEWMPLILTVLVPMHIFGIYRYLQHPKKTRGQTVFLLTTTILFVLSIGFHFTEIHDHLIRHH